MKNYLTNDDGCLFEMSNLQKDDTGIDCIIWVSSKAHHKHGPRIKLSSNNRSNNLDIVITIGDDTTLIHGKLKNKVLKKVIKWVILNKKTLMDYWNDNLSTRQMLNNIKKV